MRYLFLCNEGINRSPTAAAVAREIAQRKGLDIEMVSRGIDSCSETVDELRRYFSEFDRIFAIEHHIKLEMVYDYGIDEKKVFFIYAHEEYERDDPELRRLFQEKLEKLIG